MIQFCNHMAGSVLVYYFLIDERELVFQFLHFDRLLRLGSLTGANDLNVLWNYITFEDCHHEKSYRTRDLTKLRQHSLTWGVLWYNIVALWLMERWMGFNPVKCLQAIFYAVHWVSTNFTASVGYALDWNI